MAIDVNTAMNQIGAALGTITGLRVHDYPKDVVQPPAAIVALPETIEYDHARARGADRATFKVFVLVGKVSDRTSRDVLAGYMSGTGASTSAVKAAVDAIGPAVRVMRATTMTMTIAGQDLLCAEFDVDYVA